MRSTRVVHFASKGCLLVLLLAGCGRPAAPEPSSKGPAQAGSPAEMLVEQLRSGGIQAKAGASTLSDVRDEIAKDKPGAGGDDRDALMQIEDLVDSGADACAEYGVDPPSLAEVKADFARSDDQRKKAITDLNDALVDLRDAKGTADSLVEASESFQALADLLGYAIKDVEEAVKAFGGRVVEDGPSGSGQSDPSKPA